MRKYLDPNEAIIRLARTRLRSIAEFARRAGVSEAVASRWIHGVRPIPVAREEEVAKLLGGAEGLVIEREPPQ